MSERASEKNSCFHSYRQSGVSYGCCTLLRFIGRWAGNTVVLVLTQHHCANISLMVCERGARDMIMMGIENCTRAMYTYMLMRDAEGRKASEAIQTTE